MVESEIILNENCVAGCNAVQPGHILGCSLLQSKCSDNLKSNRDILFALASIPGLDPTQSECKGTGEWS
jgi:hypothetical protein